jgi:FkbM family methyltransferase
VLKLDNGLKFYAPKPMRGAACYLHREIFARKRYWRPGFEILPSDTVVDIGANMGMFVLWAAPQAHAGQVLAIEPCQQIHGCLQNNILRNGLRNVETMRTAVGADDTEIELVSYPGFNIVSHQRGWRPAAMTRLLIGLIYRRYRSAPVVERVACMSLGRILDAQRVGRVDLLKIDCEGGEYEILRALQPQDWERIDRVAMEFHELHPTQRHQELVQILKSQGFYVEVRKPLLEYHLMRFGEIWASRFPAPWTPRPTAAENAGTPTGLHTGRRR